MRYYLIKEVSFGSDGNISKDKLERCINSDLANNYGNLCQRVVSFCEKNMNSEILNEINFNDDDNIILSSLGNNYDKILNYVDYQDINSYITFVVDRLFASNKYFNDQEPWKKKSDINRLNTIVYTALELIRKITILLYPIIPDTSLKVMKIFNLSQDDIKLETIKNNKYLKIGTQIQNVGILFKKLEKND